MDPEAKVKTKSKYLLLFLLIFFTTIAPIGFVVYKVLELLSCSGGDGFGLGICVLIAFFGGFLVGIILSLILSGLISLWLFKKSVDDTQVNKFSKFFVIFMIIQILAVGLYFVIQFFANTPTIINPTIETY